MTELEYLYIWGGSACIPIVIIAWCLLVNLVIWITSGELFMEWWEMKFFVLAACITGIVLATVTSLILWLAWYSLIVFGGVVLLAITWRCNQ